MVVAVERFAGGRDASLVGLVAGEWFAGGQNGSLLALVALQSFGLEYQQRNRTL